MEDKKVADAAWTLLTLFQEANRIVAEHLMAAQEHNRKLAEEFFTEGMGGEHVKADLCHRA